MDLEFISRHPLFSGIAKSELSSLMQCLSASEKKYEKGGFMLSQGERMERVGIVLAGSAVVSRQDADGNRIVVSELGPGDMFGEAFAFGRVPSAVDVQAAGDCTALWLDISRMAGACATACARHSRLIENMLGILAGKVLLLNRRIDFAGKRTIREKVEAYLQEQQKINRSNGFTIPYDREELADFLFADRSALSRELSKMRDEGLIRFSKNKFEIIRLESD